MLLAQSSSFLRCSQCSLGKLCLPVGLGHEDMLRLEEIIDSSKPYKENEVVYRAGDTFDRIYAVKSGMFKTTVVDATGNDHIIGFHLPGELFGLDAIYPQKYTSTPVALTTSAVCAIDYNQLSILATKIPSLQGQLLSLMSKEVHVSHTMMGEYSAEQKIASFILSLSSRYKQRGYSATRFNLQMPRRDIANHLAMAPETVSRMFRRLINEGTLDIQQTDLTITNMERLKIIAGCESAV